LASPDGGEAPWARAAGQADVTMASRDASSDGKSSRLPEAAYGVLPGPGVAPAPASLKLSAGTLRTPVAARMLAASHASHRSSRPSDR